MDTAINTYFDFPMSFQLKQYHQHRLEERRIKTERIARREAARAAVFTDGITNSKQLPEDDPRRVEYETACAAERVPLPFKERMKELWSLIVSAEEKERYEAAWKDFYYSDHTLTGEPDERLSPDGEFKLVVTRHLTAPGCWAYTKGTLYAMVLGSWVYLSEIRRNYSSFWHLWLYREDGQRFLFGGESYMGQTWVNLDTGEKTSHLPSEAGLGAGFCWVDVTPNHDGTMLAVEGCFWACPYEVRFYDWTDTDLPPLCIGYADYEECHGWSDDGQSFLVGQTRLIRVSDGLDIERAWDMETTDDDGNLIMTDEEYERLEGLADSGDTSEAEYRKQSHLWTRPSSLELYSQDVEYLKRLRRLAEDYPDKYAHFDDSKMRERIVRHWGNIPVDERPGLFV